MNALRGALRPCVERFAEYPGRAPQRIAVSGPDGSLTYGELDRRSNQLAHALRGRGVGPGALVGLCARPGGDLIVAILAIHKAGAGYLPLDPAYPDARLEFLVTDAGPCHVVADHERPGIEKLVDGVTRLDAERAGIAAMPSGPLAVSPMLDDPAYVIYTSGTTGAPKGVVLSHRNMARLFTQTDRWFGFSSRDVWTLFHSYAFDFSVWEIWGALAYGGRLVVVPPLVSRSPEDFRQLVRRERVTVLNQTPSAFAAFIAADGTAVDPLGELSLRYVIFGGDTLNPVLLRPWVRRHGLARPRLVNMYGVTETTVHATYHVLTEAEVISGRGTIGVPIPDLRFSLRDDRLRPVPRGKIGEIFIAGGGVAGGYLNRPELTASRFLDIENERAYRTGDLARLLPNGELEYHGRCDDQVKIRGYRIEPAEIETALATHPQIHQAAVVVRNDRRGRPYLAGYVTAGQRRPDTAELIGYLRQLVPAHMIPRTFRVLDELPVTPNGKVDRHRLRSQPGVKGVD